MSVYMVKYSEKEILNLVSLESRSKGHSGGSDLCN